MNSPTARTNPVPDYTFSIIRDFGGLKPYEQAWRELHMATPGATPWQEWDWFEAWWSAMGSATELCVSVVKQGNQPVLMVPLQLRRRRMMGVPVRLLEPVGMPDEINRPAPGLGEFHEGPLRAAFGAVNGASTGRRRANAPAWDLLWLEEVEHDDPRVDVVLAWARDNGLLAGIWQLHPCPYLDLEQSWTDYLAGRGRHLARNLRAARRRLEARGAVRVDIAVLPAEIEAAFEVFLGVHARSWKAGAGLGFSQGPGYREYYREFLARLSRGGRARILTLYAGEMPVAAAIAVTDRDTYYGAQIAHDERFADCSPGTLLEALELEGLMEGRRYRSYDFFGAALTNKRRWTEEARQTSRLLVFNNTPRAWALGQYFLRVKPSLQRLRAGD